MTPETTVSGEANVSSTSKRENTFSWRPSLTRWTWVLVLGLLIAGLLMRLYTLGVLFDRDSYDEGVYWQSLRAMSAGHALYGDIFYSQPPFFLLAVYPFYALFGQTLWAARLGIALISLMGFLGALLLGKALAGRLGMVAALVLLLIDPLYLAESQTLQAEIPSVALSLLAVGLAYLWWEHPTGRKGIWLAILTAVTLVLSILAKLLTVSVLVPIGLLALAHLWRTSRQPSEARLTFLLPLLAAVGAGILTGMLVFLPFLGSFAQLWQTVVSFHTDAKGLQLQDAAQSVEIFKHAFNPFSPGTTAQGNSNSILLPLAALLGLIVALWRRDWRVLPLLAWLLATLFLLWQQRPLFSHHLIALVPSYIGLAILAFIPRREGASSRSRLRLPVLKYLPIVLASLLIACILVGNLLSIRQYYRISQARASADDARINQTIAHDLRAQLKPGQLVITDGQFTAGMADANTPAALVDLSGVRIRSGYVSTEQLIQEASRSDVQCVLYVSGRLNQLPDFHQWVKQHYQLVQTYGVGKELWVKK
jgi:4-amino-4-deoxy-L-arabinose transferase-like glycosyltransferase